MNNVTELIDLLKKTITLNKKTIEDVDSLILGKKEIEMLINYFPLKKIDESDLKENIPVSFSGIPVEESDFISCFHVKFKDNSAYEN